MWIARFYHSTLGKKVLMALTGLVLFGFIIGHLVGNLLIFVGASALDEYSAGLKAHPEVLWPARIVLLGSVLLHIGLSIQLSQLNRAARPVPYWKKENPASGLAANVRFLLRR